jgi:hypothetical protein
MVTDTHTATKISYLLMGLAVLWGIIGLSGVRSWAGDNETSRATLQGVEGVMVVVENLKPEVERGGLTQQQLQTDVELRLRQAGIRILTEQERFGVPGGPILHVNVSTPLKSDPNLDLAAVYIGIGLYQRASLETDTSPILVSTWNVESVGIVGKAHFAAIRNTVRDHVDEFINAYLSVHPRSPGNVTPSSMSLRRGLVR